MKSKAKWHAVYLIVIIGLVYWLYSEISRPIISDPHLDAFARLVEWSERLKQYGIKGRDCFKVDFMPYPELAAYYQEVTKGKVNELSASYAVVRLWGASILPQKP